MEDTRAYPIIVVTGANGGVGFGICQRLLFQLCEGFPTDSSPMFGSSSTSARLRDALSYPCDGLTLVMACRREKNGLQARQQLYDLLDTRIAWLKRQKGYDGHPEVFRLNLKINVHSVDLSMMATVLKFSRELTETYPYISHIICNAAATSFTTVDFPAAILHVLRDPIDAVTAPSFYNQNTGEMSLDGLGWVWQSNVFSHFCLTRLLQPLLLNDSQFPYDSRVIFLTSVESHPRHFNPTDFQLKETAHPYENSKYQLDLLATHLDRESLRTVPSSQKRIRYFVAGPGISATTITRNLIGPFLDIVMVVLFYLARILGSPNHPIKPFKSAISAVYLSLVSLEFVTFFDRSSKTTDQTKNVPVRYMAETDRWGTERVGLSAVAEWEAHKTDAAKLADYCDELLESIQTETHRELIFETASEKM